jgi:hypothetical protein
MINTVCTITILLYVLYSACAAVPDVVFHYRYNPSTAPLYFNAYIADADAVNLGADSFGNFTRGLYAK